MSFHYLPGSSNAIRILLWLASQPRKEESQPAVTIARAMRLSSQSVITVVGRLARAGLVETAVPGGRTMHVDRMGYPTNRELRLHGLIRLARELSEITLCEVLMLFESQPTMTECVLGGGQCNCQSPCLLHQHWQDFRSQLEKLEAMTLEDLRATNSE